MLVWAVGASAECRPGSIELRGDWGMARFSVELATTAESRAKGLMFRETLPASAGMLFVYPEPGQQAFWMKNTLIPLDMLFIAADGTVTHIHHNAVPHDLSPIHSKGTVQMVLEINGGLADRMRIAPGSQVRHPMIDQAVAVWPCGS